MNTGIKIHIATFIMFLVVAFICVYNNNVGDGVRYTLVVTFLASQLIVGMVSYLDDLYNKK